MNLDTVKLTQAQLNSLQQNGFCDVELENGQIETILIYGLFNTHSHDIIANDVQSKRNDDDNIN